MRTKTILVPTDFSAGAANALEMAAEIAADTGGRIVLLHVDPLLPVDPRDAGLGPLDRKDQTRRCLDEIAAQVKVPCDVEVEVGDAAMCILQCARERHADMIVMATHGRRGLARVLLGSVAEEVLRAASCPVLCVPPGAAHAEAEIGFTPEAARPVEV